MAARHDQGEVDRSRPAGRGAVLALGALAIVAGLAACEGMDAGTSEPEPTRLSVLLTDSPAALDEAVVTITDIELQAEGGAPVWVRGPDAAPVTRDLLALRNDVVALVDEATVPSGEYPRLRIVVTGAYIRLPDGSIYATDRDYAALPEDTVPVGELRLAASAAPVALPLGGVVLGGEPRALLIDFDAGASFRPVDAAADAWELAPRLTAIDFDDSGAIVVLVRPADGVEIPAEALTALGDRLATTLTDADGASERTGFDGPDEARGFAAAFRFLIPGRGPFEVGLELAGGGLGIEPDAPTTVTLPPGGVDTVEFRLTRGGATGR